MGTNNITIRNGFLLLLLLVFAAASLIMVGGRYLGLQSFFASFMFLWYWATVEKAEFNRLIPSLAGALVGVVLAWQLYYLPIKFGENGLIIALFIICTAILGQIMNWAPVALNASAMLYVTVLAAPALLSSANFIDISKSITIGALYFAVLAAYVAKHVAVYIIKTAIFFDRRDQKRLASFA